MLKRVVCLILSVCLIATFAACGESGDKGSSVKTAVMQKGTPKAVGDVFTLPEIKSGGDNAPIIVGITKQANPDDTVIVTGSGFSQKDTVAYVYSQNKKDNGKAQKAQFTVTEDETMQVIIDKSLDYGMYGIYVENANGKSEIELVNKPNIWWISTTVATSGYEVSIYGENLSTDNKNKSNVFIVGDKKYCAAKILYADPYKVTIEIPDTLTDAEQYEIWLHNGHGGENGFAVANEKITYYSDDPMKWEGKKIDVTDFGANPADDKKDDSAAIQKAVDSASDGDIIYFPKGVYLCKTSVQPNVSVKFEGEGVNKTTLVMGNGMKEEEGMFHIKVGPVEFKGLKFKDVRKTNFKNSFINYQGDGYATDAFNLYVHDCMFVQETSAIRRSIKACIVAQSAVGVIIDDNKFSATQICFTNDVEKIFVTNTDFAGTLYVTHNYHQNATLFWNTYKADISNNKFYGRDELEDKTNQLDYLDTTAGRAIAIQCAASEFYIANNTMVHTGLPNDNAGEQVLIENLGCLYLGGIKSATETELVMPDDFVAQVPRNALINIVAGKGMSQHVTAAKIKGKVITLAKPLKIVPDSTTRVLINNCFKNFAVYANYMDCHANYSEDPGATCGVQQYGSAVNLYITDNVFKNMSYGLCISPHHIPSQGNTAKNGIYWCNIDGNVIENVNLAMKCFVLTEKGSGDIPMRMTIGLAARRNKVANATDFAKESWKGEGGYGFIFGSPYIIDNGMISEDWPGEWQHGLVIENSIFDNCEFESIALYRHQAKTVLRGNKDSSGKEIKAYVHSGADEPIILK